MRSTRVLLISIISAVLLFGPTIGAVADSDDETTGFPTGKFAHVDGTDFTIEFDEDGTGRGSSEDGVGWCPSPTRPTATSSPR